MRRWLLLLFLATIAIDWPQLPFNARATDAVFVVAAVAILAKAKWSWPRFTALDLAVGGYHRRQRDLGAVLSRSSRGGD